MHGPDRRNWQRELPGDRGTSLIFAVIKILPRACPEVQMIIIYRYIFETVLVLGDKRGRMWKMNPIHSHLFGPLLIFPPVFFFATMQ